MASNENELEYLRLVEQRAQVFFKRAKRTLKNGCGDSCCVFVNSRDRGGQHTNGGCRCFDDGLSATAIKALFNALE